MKAEPKSALALDLPHLAEVFEALRRGRHLCQRDGELFQDLQQREALYTELLEKIGFKLVRHPRDFFYLVDASNFTELSERMAVFMFVLVEHLSDRGDAVEETVLTRQFAYADLPHLQVDRYQTYMREAGVATAEELSNVVRTMERFGFARSVDETSFRFEAPVYRFLDLCMELSRQAGKAEKATTDHGEAGEALS
jgi:ADP-ribose pyrophosphatase YjhB (NUDIX family)